MRRLWIILALVLSACATPTEPPPPAATSTPTQPTPSPTPTPSPEPESPPLLTASLLSIADVAREMGLPFSSTTTNHRLEMVQSGTCNLDCASMTFSTENGNLDVTIYMIAFTNEAEASDMRLFMHNEAITNDAEGIPLPSTGAYLEGLPEAASVFNLDRTWLVFARHNHVFLSVGIDLHAASDEPMSQDDIVLLGYVAARLTALQAVALEEVGY